MQKAKPCERGANPRQARRAESFINEKKEPLKGSFKWRERRADLRTDGARRVWIANRLSGVHVSAKSETL